MKSIGRAVCVETHENVWTNRQMDNVITLSSTRSKIIVFIKSVANTIFGGISEKLKVISEVKINWKQKGRYSKNKTLENNQNYPFLDRTIYEK